MHLYQSCELSDKLCVVSFTAVIRPSILYNYIRLTLGMLYIHQFQILRSINSLVFVKKVMP